MATGSRQSKQKEKCKSVVQDHLFTLDIFASQLSQQKKVYHYL